MNISLKAVFFSLIVMFGLIVITAGPIVYLFGGPSRNISTMGLFPSLLFLAAAIVSQLVAGYTLARTAPKEKYVGSLLLLLVVLALFSVKSGVLWIVVNTLASLVLLLLGRVFVRR